MKIFSNRCPLDDEGECYPTEGDFIICEHLSAENAIWTPMAKSMKPRLICPIKMVGRNSNNFEKAKKLNPSIFL